MTTILEQSVTIGNTDKATFKLAGSQFILNATRDQSASELLGIFADNLSALLAYPESVRSIAYRRHDELRSVLRSARTSDGELRFWRYGMPEQPTTSMEKLPRVAQCATRLIPGQAGALMRNGDSAHFHGLIRCGSAACPVCGPRKLERESLALLWLWAEADKRGFKPVMATLTASHHAGMSLASFHSAMLKAMEKFRSHRRMRKLIAKFGILPMIRRSEVLFGRNGWHSHLHLLIFGCFSFSDDELLELNRTIDSIWISALASAGLSGIAGIRAQVTRVHSAHAAQYVAKFGKEPQQHSWHAADETIRSHAKGARGLSLNELIDISAGAQPTATNERWLPSPEVARAALVEYYAFMRKRRMIDGMKRLAEALELSIAEVRASVESEMKRQKAEAAPAEMVMPIDSMTLSLLVRTRTRAKAIAIAENRGSESDIWAMLNMAARTSSRSSSLFR